MPTRNDASRPICRFLLFVLCVSMRYLPIKFATIYCHYLPIYLPLIFPDIFHYFLSIFSYYSIYSYYFYLILIFWIFLLFIFARRILNILSFLFCAQASFYYFITTHNILNIYIFSYILKGHDFYILVVAFYVIYFTSYSLMDSSFVS